MSSSGSAPARQEHGGHDGHGEVEHAGHSGHAAPVVVNGVSSDDEPSVEWGWHGHYPKAARLGGFLVAAICLVMLIGNHVGKQEDIWLVVIGAFFLALSIGAIVRQRTSWRR